MSQCPVCSSPIQDSFGLVECPTCHKILFADFDGTLKVHEDGGASTSTPDSPNEFEADWAPEEVDPSPESFDPIVEPNEESEVEDDGPLQDLTPIEEINQFANSEASSLKNGELIYDLTIKNIDTEDLKDEILEVLKESKLNIDIKKLKFALPTLELKDLNPVKVSVIVSRIKHLPVDLEWNQKSAIVDEGSNLE